MNKADNIIPVLIIFVIVIFGYLLVKQIESIPPAHDHEVYVFKWANGHKGFEYTICGDSTLVTHSGKHIGFIPKRLKEDMEAEKEL